MIPFFQCFWHRHKTSRCTARATQIIIFGCLNHHIEETLFCYPHAIEWTDRFNSDDGWFCMDCYEQLADYELLRMIYIKDYKELTTKHTNHFYIN